MSLSKLFRTLLRHVLEFALILFLGFLFSGAPVAAAPPPQLGNVCADILPTDPVAPTFQQNKCEALYACPTDGAVCALSVSIEPQSLVEFNALFASDSSFAPRSDLGAAAFEKSEYDNTQLLLVFARCDFRVTVLGDLARADEWRTMAHGIDQKIQAQPNCGSSPDTSAYELNVEQIRNDPAQALTYQPLAFQFTLTNNGAPVANELVRVQNPWNDLRGGIWRVFQATQCANCDALSFQQDTYYMTQGGVDDIALRTDANGRAQLTLFLNLAQLAAANLLPSRVHPLHLGVVAQFIQGDGAGKKVAAETSTEVEIDSIAIVEKILYTRPTIWDTQTGGERFDSQRSDALAYFDETLGERGTQVEAWILKGAERVRRFPAGATYMTGQSGPPPGYALQVGEFLGAGDSLFITACGLPVPNKTQDGLPVGQPASVSVQVRFFDGGRGSVIVNSRVCQEAIALGTFVQEISIAANRTFKQQAFVYLESVKEFVLGESSDKGREELAIVFKIPQVGKAVGALDNVGKFIKYLKKGLGYESVYVRLNSEILLDHDADGALTVTTREGEPIVITRETNDEGVAVPVGKTARIGDDLMPQVQDTTPEAARRADALLENLASEDNPSAANTQNAPPPQQPTADASLQLGSTLPTTAPATNSAPNTLASCGALLGGIVLLFFLLRQFTLRG